MHIGIVATPAPEPVDHGTVEAAARAAEQLGYRSVWLLDGPGPGTDPVVAAGLVAATTTRVRIGVALSAPRSTTELDRALDVLEPLGEGRVVLALPAANRLARRRVPVLVAAPQSGELAELVPRADGWLADGRRLGGLAPTWQDLRRRAGALGRDPSELLLVVHAVLALGTPRRGAGREPFTGELDEVVADLLDADAAGADEVVLQAAGTSLDARLTTFAAVADAVESARHRSPRSVTPPRA